MVRCYGNLYSQARVEALEKLDVLPQLADATELKSKILFSVVVVSRNDRPGSSPTTCNPENCGPFSVGVQVDAGYVEPEKGTSQTAVVLPDAGRFSAHRAGSFHLHLHEEDRGHIRFDPMHRGIVYISEVLRVLIHCRVIARKIYFDHSS